MSTSYNPKTIVDGLVLYVDSANPKSYPGTGIDLSDLSGNDLDGTLVDGVGFSADKGGVFTFITDDRVTFENSTLLM